MKKWITALFSACVLVHSSFGQGRIAWDESINGPFSNDYRQPTSLSAFMFGTNSVMGATSSEPTGNDWLLLGDFFTFTVPNGSSLSGVYVSVDKANVWAWLGDSTFSAQLAFVQDTSSGDLLQQWGLPSIGAGTYGMYMMNANGEASTSIANYRLDFLIQGSPEPSASALAVLGVALTAIRRWRR